MSLRQHALMEDAGKQDSAGLLAGRTSVPVGRPDASGEYRGPSSGKERPPQDDKVGAESIFADESRGSCPHMSRLPYFPRCSGFAIASTCWPTIIRRFAGLGSTANSWAGDSALRADSRFLGDEAAFGMTNALGGAHQFIITRSKWGLVSANCRALPGWTAEGGCPHIVLAGYVAYNLLTCIYESGIVYISVMRGRYGCDHDINSTRHGFG
jgi:hypothetical protein